MVAVTKPPVVSHGTSASPATWARRLAAVLEIVGVFVAGTLLARLAARGLDLGPANLRAVAPGEPLDFVSLSGAAAAHLLLRYGFVLGLAFVVGWWHRKRRLSEYGVTAAGRPARDHVSIGILLFAAASLPALGWKFLGSVLPLGPGPAHWGLLRSLDTPGIWLYLFVGSFGLVPIVEELWARGYVQSRLAEDFGSPAAIVLTALFFTFAHTQYFIASALGVGMLVSLFVGSIAAGYVRYRTGSLLPGMIAHALGNVPYRGWTAAAVIALMALVVVIWRRATAAYASGLWQEVAHRAAFIAASQAVAVLVVLLALVLYAPAVLPWAAALALGAAVLLETRDRAVTRR